MAAKLAALIVPLGLDTFAVAAGLGAAGMIPARRLRTALLFSAFEAIMPLIGLGIGAPLGHTIGSAADYLAGSILILVGGYMIVERADREERLPALAEWHVRAAILLGLSVSLDELVVGFTFGLLRLPVAVVVGLIALQAFVVTQLGLRLGARLSLQLREGAERVAGLALVGLGVVLLLEKVLG